MDWTEIIIKTDHESSDDIAAVLQMVSSGIYIEDYENLEESIMEISHVDLIDEELLARDREIVTIHMYISSLESPVEKIDFVKERLVDMGVPFEIIIGKIDDEDWANNWKKHYKPFDVGDKLLIKPEWETIDDSRGRVVLNIAPGLAFGTGTHESTKMCLMLLENYVSSDKKILDVGCGSGILSIAALLLGAESAVAIDIDPLAVKITKENGVLNNFFEDRLRVVDGNLVDKLREETDKFDVITANIIADVIVGISPQIGKYMNEDAVFICSGIIDDKLATVKTALLGNGFVIDEILEEKGWAAVSARLGGS